MVYYFHERNWDGINFYNIRPSKHTPQTLAMNKLSPLLKAIEDKEKRNKI